MSQRGHLFIVQADLTRLAADAFLVPCDDELNVSGTWRPFLQSGASPQAKEDWFVPQGVQLENGLAVLPDTTPKNPTPDQVVGLRVLVDTVGVDDIAAMVTRSLDAVRLAASQAQRHGGRILPLVAMPVLGVGQGNFKGHRAEVVRELLRRLLDFVAQNPIDVALSLTRTSDFAAAQWARHRLAAEGRDCWPELNDEHAGLADRLGAMASRGELSVFAGAGVSKPVGFPDWNQLIRDVSRKPKLRIPDDADYPQLAQKLGLQNKSDMIAALLTTSKHALGHALLVNLRTPSLVTTNYDPCFENAAELIHQDPKLRVIARELAVGGRPWLLKLHGDVADPPSIVLTTSQYARLKDDHAALRGVVQTLMLTSHLLFVGFGFAASDFLAMSTAVKNVRSLAKDMDAEATVGTAIALCGPAKKPHEDDLDHHHMRVGDDHKAAARDLEILLDRLSWRCQVEGQGRAGYLLDPDYQQDAHGHDQALVEALSQLRKGAESWRNSAGAKAVNDLLLSFGARPNVAFP